MKILITGSNGMLGKAIVNRFKDNRLILPSHKDLDISKREDVLNFVNEKRPGIIINCAAYTNTLKAEKECAIEAYKANILGPSNLAEAARMCHAIMIHFSSDYVYGGGRPLLLKYTEKSYTCPVNRYGVTKRDGDLEVQKNTSKYYIFRTSWLFGDGNNFVDNVIESSKSKSKQYIVADQWGSPTYTVDLANIVYQVLKKKLPYGIYNATNLGFTTWYKFAKMILPNNNISPISSKEFGGNIMRPKNSKLSKRKILKYGIEIPTFENALIRYLEMRK